MFQAFGTHARGATRSPNAEAHRQPPPALAMQRCLSVSIENLTIIVGPRPKSYSEYHPTLLQYGKYDNYSTPTVSNPFPRNLLPKQQGARPAQTMRSSPLRFRVPPLRFIPCRQPRDSTALKRSYAGLGLELQEEGTETQKAS